MKFFGQVRTEFQKMCFTQLGSEASKLGKSLGFLLILFFIFPTYVFPAESPFTVSLVVTGSADVTPPSTPTGLSATAISTSQIDLSWTASTDDFAVIGYKVYRDTVHIATPTGTTFSDTGLIASTVYSYTVSATDFAGNESAQSATSTVTTQSQPTPTPSVGGGAFVEKIKVALTKIISPPILIKCKIADFNCDRYVNVPDLSMLLYHYGKTGPNINPFDLKRDDVINLRDISVVFHYWDL